MTSDSDHGTWIAIAKGLDRTLTEALQLIAEQAGWDGPPAPDWRERANRFLATNRNPAIKRAADAR